MWGKKKVQHMFKSRQAEHLVMLDGISVIHVVYQTNGTIEIHHGHTMKQFYHADAAKHLRDIALSMNAIADEIETSK